MASNGLSQSYVDVEAFLVAYLTAQFPTYRICTELPAAITKTTVQVVRIAGTESTVIDTPTVSVDVYAVDRLTANDAAAKVRAALNVGRFAGYTQGPATVALISTISAPGWRPYDDTNVRRVGATYAISIHNH
jgi:hypothetical protein